MSPFCNMSRKTDPAKWATDVQSLYESMPEYVKFLPSPMRDNYDTEKRRSDELLQTLVEVIVSN